MIWKSNYVCKGKVFRTENIEAPNRDCALVLMARRYPDSEMMRTGYFDPYIPWQSQAATYGEWWQRFIGQQRDPDFSRKYE